MGCKPDATVLGPAPGPRKWVDFDDFEPLAFVLLAGEAVLWRREILTDYAALGVVGLLAATLRGSSHRREDPRGLRAFAARVRTLIDAVAPARVGS